MPSPSSQLFRQIISESQALLRLKLQSAKGDTAATAEATHLAQSIALKQTLLEAQSSPAEEINPLDI